MPHEHLTTPLEDLDARVKELERRLSALERISTVESLHQDSPGSKFAPQVLLTAIPNESQPSIFPVLGQVTLGISGAYLLRAAAESGVFPPGIIVIAALVYAAAWLVWASRSHSGGKFACYSYGITAALILSPMLWEVTVRFRLLQPSVTAAVIAGFAALAFTLAWPRNDSHVVWPGMLSAVITALLLMPATRALVPFTVTLLFIALLTEFAADCGRWLGFRLVSAAAADLACLLLVLILGDSMEVPPEYYQVTPAVLIALLTGLFAIYALNAFVRSIVLRVRISALESTQLAITALLAVWGVLRITHGSGGTAIGALMLLGGSLCYFAAFAYLARGTGRLNFHFYSGCGLAFILTGSFFTFPNSPLVVELCLAAAVTTALGVIGHSATLDLHGVVYLGAAVYASHLLEYAAGALAGTHTSSPTALVLFTAAVTLLCSAIVSRYPGERWMDRFLRLLPAILAAYSAAALAVATIVWLMAPGASLAPPQLAVIRTVVTCAAALLLVFVGSRWNRREFVWMAYGAVVLGGFKLVVEDLRLGNTRSLALSLFFYGAVLILIPRLGRVFLSASHRSRSPAP